MTDLDRGARSGRPTAGVLHRAARKMIWYVREVVGENDFQRYVDHLRTRHPDVAPPPRSESERMKTRRLESHPNTRCC